SRDLASGLLRLLGGALLLDRLALLLLLLGRWLLRGHAVFLLRSVERVHVARFVVRVKVAYGLDVIVFVHGVPETAEMWDKMRAEIDGDSIAVSLPGFGCERPAGFPATKDAYADWLIGELEKTGEPVDLVGHDWGAGLTYRVG